MRAAASQSPSEGIFDASRAQPPRRSSPTPGGHTTTRGPGDSAPASPAHAFIDTFLEKWFLPFLLAMIGIPYLLVAGLQGARPTQRDAIAGIVDSANGGRKARILVMPDVPTNDPRQDHHGPRSRSEDRSSPGCQT